MPAYCSVPDAAAVKIVGVYQSNRPRGLPTIAGVVISIDPDTGACGASSAPAALTAARTAAATGACMARLAPARPGPLGMTGAGVEARTHLLVADALGWHDVAVYDHRASNIDDLAAWAAEHVPAVRIRGVASPGDAAEGAACVVTGHPDRRARRDAADRVGARRRARAADRLLHVGRRRARQLRRAARERRSRTSSPRWPSSATSRAGARSTAPSGAGSPTVAPRDPAGRVVVANLGVGAHDAVFAQAILDRAERGAVGVLLPE